MGMKKYANGFSLTLHEDVLGEPFKWKGPSSVFVCSMSDIFHEEVPFEFVDGVMETIRGTRHHKYQMLTKRVGRMGEYFSDKVVPGNLWLGVTVESSLVKARAQALKGINSGVRFLSCEPLIDDIGEIDLSGIDWIIVGGESGVKARPMKVDWVRSLLKQARLSNVAFYFKQWGTWGADGIKRSKKKNGNCLDGQAIQMMPGEKSGLVFG
jgi:protein gp37